MEHFREILQIKPGKCKGKRPEAGVEFSVAEEKIDGHRALLHLGSSLRRSYLTSRRIAKSGLYAENGLSVPHIVEPADAFSRKSGLEYTVMDGEVLLPGRAFEDVQSVMGSNVDKALSRQEELGQIQFNVFDLLFYNGEDIRGDSWKNRHNLLQILISQMSLSEEHLKLVPHFSGHDHTDFYSEIVEKGGEGLVIKFPNSKYGQHWFKWKKEETYDVIVMGFTAGKNKYREMFGAVEFGAYKNGELVKIGRCSGMSDGDCGWKDDEDNRVRPNTDGCKLVPNKGSQQEGTRAWFHQNREKLIGSVIEVECSGVTKHGNLRHPRFFRTRVDKPANECLAP